jgi:hypothetical protein
VLIDVSKLFPAVAYWLNYKNLTGMNDLFSEASLTVPIAEYLSRKHIHFLRSEVTHPTFRYVKGRPRQIDFVGTDKRDRWSFAIEAKFFPISFQEAMNDVGRLLVLDKIGCEKLLMIAGPRGEDGFKINMIINHRRTNEPLPKDYDFGDLSQLVGTADIVADLARGIHIRITTDALIGGLWWQLAKKLSGETNIQFCRYCNSPFETGPGTGRHLDATFCCNEHKVRYYSLARTKKKKSMLLGEGT